MDFRNAMKELQKLTKDFEKMEKEMEMIKEEVSIGGGAVKLVMNGLYQIEDIKINPEVVDPEDTEFLCDLIKAAVNTANDKIREKLNERISSVLPFPIPPGLF